MVPREDCLFGQLGRWEKIDFTLRALCLLPSHHRADAAIALLIATVAPKTRLRDCLDRLLDRTTRAR